MNISTYLHVCTYAFTEPLLTFRILNHRFIVYLQRLDVLDRAIRKQTTSIQGLPCFKLLRGYKTCLQN